MSGQKRRKRDFFVHFFSDDADTFAHGKGGEDSADAQSFDVTEAEKCHAGGDGQADNVKGDFDPRVADVGNLRTLSREEVCRDDRHLAAVGQRDAKGDDDVAQDKIKDSQRQ